MNFGVIDFEALDYNRLYAVGVGTKNYALTFFSEKPNNTEVIEQALIMLKTLNMNTGKTIIYAHNGGKYDFLPIAQFCADMEIPFKIPYLLHGRVAALNVFSKKHGLNLKFRDSYPLLPASLKNLTESFEVKHRKLNPNEENDYSKRTTEEYLINDVKGLYEVLEKFFTFYGKNGGKGKPLTVSAAAYSLFWKKYNADNFKKLWRVSNTDEFYIRKSYYGGRTEVFKRIFDEKISFRNGFKFPLYYYDVNSLYPSQMLDNKYPVGSYSFTEVYEPGIPGIYEITWSSPEKWLYAPFLPFRHEGKLIFPNGENMHGWYCSPEIEYAKTLGYSIKVHKGYVWKDDAYIFKDYVRNWYAIKKQSSGAKREVSKLMLNSLYGRFAMKRERDLILNEEQYTELLQKGRISHTTIASETPFIAYKTQTDGRNPRIIPHISSFVTAYARIKLYEYLKKCRRGIWYSDTDSILTDTRLPTSKELGDLKLEHTLEEGYFILPKLYALRVLKGSQEWLNALEKGNSTEIRISKGMDSKLLDFEAYKKAALKGDLSEFEVKKWRILGFRESIARHRKFFEAEVRPKRVKSDYDKREILKGGFETVPITLRNIGGSLPNP